MTIPRDDQIRSILAGQISDLAYRYAAGDLAALEPMWTVTAAEVVNAALTTGITSSWVHWQRGQEDGLYVVSEDALWRLEEQERGQRLWYREFNRKEEAVEACVLLFLLPDALKP